ncbi:hypothetical protein L2719_12035 [Shewanella schlegeliana]|uniref:Uncharacterized protein n=1 Tax=Shewanella schlegeliana TaxID=190308 RepID=A0ABS1STA5_9GAMM|nr:hypothetical protein [Shewanella schlegeliana]MBL4911771.1 hypothetical protein [Shewanella schlegeliana]MCL1110277.1 hypothetical protein [Shewanella schlegeliana]GIU35962.1 hypothetical protein TUM4433_34080 [Shewanella schlegeliana]
MKTLTYISTSVLLFASASASASASPLTEVNKYSEFKTFSSVVVQCPIDKTWKTIGNVKNWFKAVLGDSLVSITVTGEDRELQSVFSYDINTGTQQDSATGHNEERLIELSDFNYQLVTTFNSSTLPLMPWTTKVTLEKVTYIDVPVDYTLVKFAQSGVINVPSKMQAATIAKIEQLFDSVFAPSLKEKFDDCL